MRFRTALSRTPSSNSAACTGLQTAADWAAALLDERLCLSGRNTRPVPSHGSNARISALLKDLAAAQTAREKRFAYRRAADAVMALDEPIEALVQPDGTLRKIPNVGPSSAKVILEALATGGSERVERAVAESASAADVARSRELRDDVLSRADVVQALGDTSLRGPALKDYRGDLQMHSDWSDGRATIAEMADGCVARGYVFSAITDHGHGLSIAGGVSAAELAEQHKEIDAINRRYGKSFRLLKGVEANIQADGQLDLSAEELRSLDVVLAAPHSKLRTSEDQTMRLVTAIATPGVHVLAHPRGRKIGMRPGLTADWDLVFAAAAKLGVAIELDGDPSRQDLDFSMAKRALALECLFAVDSDAHSVRELAYVETAIAHARLAGIPKDRIINCWGLTKLLAWLPTAWAR
jgi:histidinol phosphatase-like PHP family hydrolase